jgi:hypothetical protein
LQAASVRTEARNARIDVKEDRHNVNIVADRVVNIAAKARTGSIAQRATAAGTYGHGDGLI